MSTHAMTSPAFGQPKALRSTYRTGLRSGCLIDLLGQLSSDVNYRHVHFCHYFAQQVPDGVMTQHVQKGTANLQGFHVSDV